MRGGKKSGQNSDSALSGGGEAAVPVRNEVDMAIVPSLFSEGLNARVVLEGSMKRFFVDGVKTLVGGEWMLAS